MFNHNFVDIKKIKQINRESGRVYQTPENRKYPSITTVLSQTKDQSFLVEWRKRVGEEEADRITRRAALRGTDLHLACEHYLLNKKPDLSKIATKRNFQQLEPMLKNIDNVRGLEIPLYSDILKIAGTADCIAEYKGVLSIIDFKTSRKPKKEEWIEDYFLQCTFYAFAYKELYGEFPKKLQIIMATDCFSPCIFTKDIVQYKSKLIERRKNFYKKRGL